MLDGGKGSGGGKGDSGGKGVNRFEPYDYGKGKGKGKGKDKGKDKGMSTGKGKSKGTGKGGTAEGQVCLYQCTGYTLARSTHAVLLCRADGWPCWPRTGHELH